MIGRILKLFLSSFWPFTVHGDFLSWLFVFKKVWIFWTGLCCLEVKNLSSRQCGFTFLFLVGVKVIIGTIFQISIVVKNKSVSMLKYKSECLCNFLVCSEICPIFVFVEEAGLSSFLDWFLRFCLIPGLMFPCIVFFFCLSASCGKAEINSLTLSTICCVSKIDCKIRKWKFYSPMVGL